MSTSSNIYVVSDDRALVERVRRECSFPGLSFHQRTNEDEFQQKLKPDAMGCVVVDARDCDEESATRLVQRVHTPECSLTICVLLKARNIVLTVQFMQFGVVTVFDDETVTDEEWSEGIRSATQASELLHSVRQDIYRVTGLHPRERAVLRKICEGLPRANIARDLGISLRGVEGTRGHLHRKLNAASSADLARIMMSYEFSRNHYRYTETPHLCGLLFGKFYYSSAPC